MRAVACRQFAPRNARAVVDLIARKKLKYGSRVVVSFVGDTPIQDAPHVYADSGRRYDWSFLFGLQVEIVVRPGVDCAHAVAAIFDQAQLYPTIIDYESQVVGSVVERSGRVWPRRKGSEPWLALFG